MVTTLYTVHAQAMHYSTIRDGVTCPPSITLEKSVGSMNVHLNLESISFPLPAASIYHKHHKAYSIQVYKLLLSKCYVLFYCFLSLTLVSNSSTENFFSTQRNCTMKLCFALSAFACLSIGCSITDRERGREEGIRERGERERERRERESGWGGGK